GQAASQLSLRLPKEWQPWLRQLRAARGSVLQRALEHFSIAALRGSLSNTGIPRLSVAATLIPPALCLGMLIAVATVAPRRRPSPLHEWVFVDQATALAMSHKGGVLSAVMSPDGKRVVTASTDSTAQVWDVDSGRPVGSALRHAGVVNSARFSDDGR